MGRGCLLALPAFGIAAIVGYIAAFVAMTAIVPTPAWDMEGSWAIGIMFFIAPSVAIVAGSAAAFVVGLAAFRGPGPHAPAPFALLFFLTAGMSGWMGCLAVYQIVQAAAPARGVEMWPALIPLAPFVGLSLGLGTALWAVLRPVAEED
jgi:hypothetical protein